MDPTKRNFTTMNEKEDDQNEREEEQQQDILNEETEKRLKKTTFNSKFVGYMIYITSISCIGFSCKTYGYWKTCS